MVKKLLLSIMVMMFIFSGQIPTAQVVAATSTNLYNEPFVLDKELVLEGAMVTDEGKRYLGLEEMIKLLKGEVSFLDKKLTVNLQEKNLFHLGKVSRGVSFFDEGLTFEEEVSAHAAVVIGDTPDHILFSKNIDEQLYPASTTKIMTALVALEQGNLSEKVIVSEAIRSIPSDSSKANLRHGDELTLEQLLYAMMIPSGNDAAVAIATHISGSVDDFAVLMNEKAKEIGALQTNFVNPHGYHHREQYTTAHDLAKIAYEAFKNPQFFPLVSTATYEAAYVDKNGHSVQRTWRSTNQQISKNSPYYSPYIIGGKTGYTRASRHTLVSFAEVENYQYITVILKGNRHGRYVDTELLVSRAHEVRKAFNHERKVVAAQTVEDIALLLNGREAVIKEGVLTANGDIYLALDEFAVLKETVKKQFIRDRWLKLAINQMYFPKKYLFATNEARFFPFRSAFIAYDATTTLSRNELGKHDANKVVSGF